MISRKNNKKMSEKSSIKFLGLYIILSVFISCTSRTDKNEMDQKIKNIDPLPSWNVGATKTAIIDYVLDVTNSK